MCPATDTIVSQSPDLIQRWTFINLYEYIGIKIELPDFPASESQGSLNVFFQTHILTLLFLFDNSI